MPRIPRPKKGEPIKAEHFNILADAIERCQINTAPGSGIGLFASPSGTDLFSISSGSGIVKPAYVTTQITLRSGGTLGVGACCDSIITSPSSVPTIASSAGTPYPVYSYRTDKKFNVGAIVSIYRYRSYWFVFDVDDCTHLT